MKQHFILSLAQLMLGALIFVSPVALAEGDAKGSEQQHQDVVQKGWGKAGYNAHQYRTGFLDKQKEITQDNQVGFIQSLKPSLRSFATLMRTAGIEDYRGKRIQLTSYIKTSNAGSAGAWFRVNGKTQTLALDNMANRRLSGNKDWREVTLVLDIPTEAETVSYGVLLEGKGKVWFEVPVFHVVDETVAVTSRKRRAISPLAVQRKSTGLGASRTSARRGEGPPSGSASAKPQKSN